MVRFLLLSSLVFACCPPADAEDWPQFRGPTGQGLSSERDLPTRWSRTNHVVWHGEIGGRGWSSPVVAGHQVFLTTAVKNPVEGRIELRALALDTADGSVLWNRTVFTPRIGAAPSIHHKNSHASPTPIVEGSSVYVHFGHLGTACLDLAGKVIWTNTSHFYPPVHGSGGSPAIVNDALIFSCDGSRNPFIVALNKHTGKTLWRVPRQTKARKPFSFCTPLVIEIDGIQQIISPGSGVVNALRPENGRELWHVRYGEGYSVIPRPVYGRGLLYICTGYDRPELWAIRPDGQGDLTAGHVVWKRRRGAPHTPSPLLVGGELYIVSDGGIATCLDAKTGRTHWQERLGGSFSASPVYADHHIYLLNEAGRCFVLDASKQFRLIAKNDLEERALASPAIAQGALYIRTDIRLYKISNRPTDPRDLPTTPARRDRGSPRHRSPAPN